MQVANVKLTPASTRTFREIQDEQRALAREFNNTSMMSQSSIRIVRQDWSQKEQQIDPKNNIQLIEVADRFLPILKDACGRDKEEISEIFDQIKHVFAKKPAFEQSFQAAFQDYKEEDEILFCQKLAKEHIEKFKRNCSIVQFC